MGEHHQRPNMSAFQNGGAPARIIDDDSDVEEEALAADYREQVQYEGMEELEQVNSMSSMSSITSSTRSARTETASRVKQIMKKRSPSSARHPTPGAATAFSTFYTPSSRGHRSTSSWRR